MRPTLFILLTLLCFQSKAQVYDGVYIQEDSKPARVLERTYFKLIYERGIPKIILNYETKFDTLGRWAESKEFNSTGEIKRWAVYHYGESGDQTGATYLDKDSSVKLTKEWTYVSPGVYKTGSSRRKDGSLQHYSYHEYTDSSEVYVGWFDDSSKVSTYYYTLNNQGQKMKRTQYKGKGKDTIVDRIYFFTYHDSIKASETQHVYDTLGYKWGEIEKFDTAGNLIAVYKAKHDSIFRLKDTFKYDEYGNKKAQYSYRGDSISYASHYRRTYDSLGRLTRTEYYNCSEEEWTEETEFQTLETIEYIKRYNRRVEIKREQSKGFLRGDAPRVKVTTKAFDRDDRWVSTTVTVDGVLTEFECTKYKLEGQTEFPEGVIRGPIPNPVRN